VARKHTTIKQINYVSQTKTFSKNHHCLLSLCIYTSLV